MVVRKFFVVLEETKVVKGKYFSSMSFVCRNVKIFTGCYCENYRVDDLG